MALAMVGIADTLYLSMSVYTGVAPSCLLQGCELVLASSYSKIFGVPWAYIGLVYYVYMFGLSALLASEPYSKALRAAAVANAGIGLLNSIWAVFYIQLSVIGALCQYCAISALITLGLLGVALWHFRTTRKV